MFTHGYKNGYIHGRFDQEIHIAQIGDKTKRCKSYRAAQIQITKWSKE